MINLGKRLVDSSKIMLQFAKLNEVVYYIIPHEFGCLLENIDTRKFIYPDGLCYVDVMSITKSDDSNYMVYGTTSWVIKTGMISSASDLFYANVLKNKYDPSMYQNLEHVTKLCEIDTNDDVFKQALVIDNIIIVRPSVYYINDNSITIDTDTDKINTCANVDHESFKIFDAIENNNDRIIRSIMECI